VAEKRATEGREVIRWIAIGIAGRRAENGVGLIITEGTGVGRPAALNEPDIPTSMARRRSLAGRVGRGSRGGRTYRAAAVARGTEALKRGIPQWKPKDFSARLAETPQVLERWLCVLAGAGADAFHLS